MQVEFWIMAPGDHRRVSKVEMDVIPRVDEGVALGSGDGRVRSVHSVLFVLGDQASGPYARINLRE